MVVLGEAGVEQENFVTGWRQRLRFRRARLGFRAAKLQAGRCWPATNTSEGKQQQAAARSRRGWPELGEGEFQWQSASGSRRERLGTVRGVETLGEKDGEWRGSRRSTGGQAQASRQAGQGRAGGKAGGQEETSGRWE